MKVKFSVVLLFLTLLIGLSYSKNLQPRQKRVESIEKIFIRECSSCHGVDGKSETPKGIELAATDLTSQRVKRMSLSRLISVIKNGKGAMPPFAEKFSRRELGELAKYIKKLQ